MIKDTATRTILRLLSTLRKHVLACFVLMSCVVVAAAEEVPPTQPLSAEAMRLLIKSDDTPRVVASSLSEEAAETIAESRGRVTLVVEQLSVAVAKRLAKHEGDMSITVTRFVPEEVIKAFDEYRGDLSITTPDGTFLSCSGPTPEKTPPPASVDAEPLAVAAGPRLRRLPRDTQVGAASQGDPDGDAGWAIQSMHRLYYTKNLRSETALGKMLRAYQDGVPVWVESDGTLHRIDSLGLPPIDWPTEPVVPPWTGQGADSAPQVAVNKAPRGTSVTLGPVEVMDGLLCSITFLVIEKVPSNDNARGLDYLAAQVELFGGDRVTLKKHPEIQADTFFDLWSEKKSKRYTISQWKANRPVGHISTRAYAPLLFDVLYNEPEYILLENLKIELSERFRDGCRKLCDEVLELREAQGQRMPICQEP